MTKQIFDTLSITSALYYRLPISTPLKHQLKEIEGFYSNYSNYVKKNLEAYKSTEFTFSCTLKTTNVNNDIQTSG